MAKAKSISEQELNALFVDAGIVESVKRKARCGFFDMAVLNNVAKAILKESKPIDVNAFWNVAKIGEKKADNNHKCYYVNRAIKMALLDAKKNINLLEQNFNAPSSSKMLKEHLDNKAFKMSEVVLKDGTETILLNVDIKSAFK